MNNIETCDVLECREEIELSVETLNAKLTPPVNLHLIEDESTGGNDTGGNDAGNNGRIDGNDGGGRKRRRRRKEQSVESPVVANLVTPSQNQKAQKVASPADADVN